MIYPVKRGATLLTPADHLPCVDAFVSRQVTSRCERLPAEVTHVRPESTVCPAVYSQVNPPSKRLATVVAAEWPLAGMSSVMAFQMVHPVRGVLAPLTLVPAVPSDVAVTLVHVPVQKILSQTCVVAVGAVENAFT